VGDIRGMWDDNASLMGDIVEERLLLRCTPPSSKTLSLELLPMLSALYKNRPLCVNEKTPTSEKLPLPNDMQEIEISFPITCSGNVTGGDFGFVLLFCFFDIDLDDTDIPARDDFIFFMKPIVCFLFCLILMKKK